MMMRRLTVLFGLMLASSVPAYAQVPGINVHVSARIGAFAPMSALAETPQGDLKLQNGLGIGASVELDIPLSPINIRASVDAAMGAKMELNDQELVEGEVDVVSITGDIVFRPIPRVIVQPYLLAGAGVKRYTFKEEGFGGFVADRSNFTGHIGAGADMKLGPLSLLLEASDYISSFKNEGTDDSKLQNDVFVMVGFRIGML
jgi:hypothetical protein